MLQLPGYEITKELYHSANAFILSAKRKKDDLPVIIKVSNKEHPSPEYTARLKHEHDVLTKLAGPGVIKTFGLESINSRLALRLEDLVDCH